MCGVRCLQVVGIVVFKREVPGVCAFVGCVCVFIYLFFDCRCGFGSYIVTFDAKAYQKGGKSSLCCKLSCSIWPLRFYSPPLCVV